MTTDAKVRTDDPLRRLAELLGPDVGLPDDGHHLPECPHRDAPTPAPCEWCRWALATPDLERVLAVAHDARTLHAGGHVDSVPAVVAYHRLKEVRVSLTVEPTTVSSVRRLVDLARQAADAKLERLGRQVTAAASSGGPIEATCLHTAGGLAAVALTDDDPAAAGVEIPRSIRADLERLSSTLSARLQLAALIPLVERLHHRRLPRLLTQPEWDRRPDPGRDDAGVRLRQLHGAGLAPGSLEELVVESMLDDHLDLLVRLGGGIAEVGPRVRLSRPLSDRPHTGRTRELLWRVARIDWHLTFVDTGLATCWETRLGRRARHTDVPWVVALAIATAHRAGLTSAIHTAAPNPFRDDPTA